MVSLFGTHPKYLELPAVGLSLVYCLRIPKKMLGAWRTWLMLGIATLTTKAVEGSISIYSFEVCTC